MCIQLLFFSYSFDGLVEVCNGGILEYEALHASADEGQYLFVRFGGTEPAGGRTFSAGL